MRWWQIIIAAVLFVLPIKGRAEGIVLFQGTVYEALEATRTQEKLLLVEFYAPWSHKSRWMHDNVLIKSDVGQHFVAISIDTGTEDGAALATQYEVTDYPVILVCNASGVVIDKIDRALELPDFVARLSTARLSIDRHSVRQLQQIFSLSESGDTQIRDKVNELVKTYFASQEIASLTSRSHWDLFTTPSITYYQSESYLFLVRNVEQFFSPDDARSLIRSIISDAILPYIIGSKEFDEDRVAEIESDTLSLMQYAQAKDLCTLARLRAKGDAAQYVAVLEKVINDVSEDYEYQLVMSLDFVVKTVDHSNRSIRSTVRKMLEKLMQKSLSPSKTMLIESLLTKFS